jgi:biopolymer transport protein ExbD
MRIVRAKKSSAIIPTASMADIAFLLIIFFMVTTVHDVDRTSINLPSAVTRIKNDQGSAMVVLWKQSDGEIIYLFSDGKEKSKQVSGPGDIHLEASRLTFAAPDKQFVIKADHDIRYEKIDEIMDNLRKGGATNLLLLTHGKTEKEGE